MLDPGARPPRRGGKMDTDPLGRGLPQPKNGIWENCHPPRRKQRGFLRPLGSFSRDGFGGFLPQPPYFSGRPRRGFTFGLPAHRSFRREHFMLPHSKKQEGLISPASKAEALRPSKVSKEKKMKT